MLDWLAFRIGQLQLVAVGGGAGAFEFLRVAGGVGIATLSGDDRAARVRSCWCVRIYLLFNFLYFFLHHFLMWVLIKSMRSPLILMFRNCFWIITVFLFYSREQNSHSLHIHIHICQFSILASCFLYDLKIRVLSPLSILCASR